MQIVVNGKKLDIQDGLSVNGLLKELRVEDKVMAVAINMEIVKKDNWDTTLLKDGDKLELLHFVGGG
jgi:sulfur carrier protein